MKIFKLILLSGLVALLASCARFSGTVPPNIVLIFIDDMDWSDWSCFGNPDARTPNIDRMAAEGIAFEQFYVNSPICSPSRVAISTGQYPQRWGITSYLAFRNRNKERGLENWLDPEAPMSQLAAPDHGTWLGKAWKDLGRCGNSWRTRHMDATIHHYRWICKGGTGLHAKGSSR